MIAVICFLLCVSNIYAFTSNINRINIKSKSNLFMAKENKPKKDLGRILQTIIFPNIYSDYEDTAAFGSAKETVKIKTEEYKKLQKELARPEYKKVKGEDMTDGKYISMDEKSVPTTKGAAFVDAMARLGKPTKPKNFKPNKPSGLKLGIATGPGAACGADVKSWPKPKKTLILYEYAGQGRSRKVREACSYLDLTVEIRPSPGARYGWSDDQARITNGERVLPFMIDASSVYTFRLRQETEIIEYLFENYGPGKDQIPKALKGKGGGDKAKTLAKNVRPDFLNFKPITLYTIEGCSASNSVRQTLDGLAIPHKVVFCAKGGNNRAKFEKNCKGNFQVPFISDPNTKCDLFESKDIVNYLNTVYGDPSKKP